VQSARRKTTQEMIATFLLDMANSSSAWVEIRSPERRALLHLRNK
jgi:hypothetical protein